ncbi:hypothetical protein RYZ26_08430 [Terasakiella sp. A23]|uniref:hypothetical protein n=1 Tax=Terasakiella sp. FCG-A23 TaxID=3080561 RepID=UPI00295470CC|nr:hypothetical protein [Terasakiella sp. A23]MDV7339615.1 hypothetical protein [Terasakiella sp. A23]
MKQVIEYLGQDGDGPLKKDYWKLLSLMLRDALANNANGVVLLRFDQLQGFAENIWEEVCESLNAIVNGEAQNILGKDDQIFGFDPSSYIVIAHRDHAYTSYELAEKLKNTIAVHMMGGPLGQSKINLLQVDAIGETGIEASGGQQEERSVPATPVAEESGEIFLEEMEDVSLIGTASFDFLPIWHIRRNFVMTFECIPRWHLENGDILDEADLSERFSRHDMEHALDAVTVRHAVDQVVRVIEHDAMASILVPVHFDTIMEEEGFSQFLQVYRELTPVWRERVSMEIKCIPDGVTFENLCICMNRLRPYCKGLYVQVPLSFNQIGDFGVGGLVSVGVDLTHETRDEIDIIADMEKFIFKTSQVPSLQTHALGLQTVSLSVAAICAGFDFIGCRPIEEELEGWGIDDFLVKPLDLYKQLLKAKT